MPKENSTTEQTAEGGGASTNSAECGLREDVVENAVNFLRNPNVAGTPLARRVAFMKRKGMTSKEIDTALARAAAVPSTSAGPAPAPPALPPRAQVYTYGSQQPQPMGTTLAPPQQNGIGWAPLIGASVLAAGLGVGASYLVSKYVLPWWNGKVGKEKQDGDGEDANEDKEIKEMLKSIDENQKNMIKSINELSQAIREQSN